MINIIAVFSSIPGMENELRNATLNIVESTRAEKGCLRFEVHEDLDHQGAFFIRETWESQQALDNHFAQPYLLELLELHKMLLSTPLKLYRVCPL